MSARLIDMGTVGRSHHGDGVDVDVEVDATGDPPLALSVFEEALEKPVEVAVGMALDAIKMGYMTWSS